MSHLERQSRSAVGGRRREGLRRRHPRVAELFAAHPRRLLFGLLGPNGSGKSTLIGMISGLVRAPAGRISVFGYDVVAQAPHARLHVGVAPQDVHLDRFLTTREVLEYHGRYFGMARLEAGRRADELLDAFDLTAKANSKPNRLSGGMRRRLLSPARSSTARAYSSSMSRPRASTSSCAASCGRTCARCIKSTRPPVLLTTHYLEEAEELCERIGFIRDGQLIDQGAIPELVERHGGGDLEDAYTQVMR